MFKNKGLSNEAQNQENEINRTRSEKRGRKSLFSDSLTWKHVNFRCWVRKFTVCFTYCFKFQYCIENIWIVYVQSIEKFIAKLSSANICTTFPLEMSSSVSCKAPKRNDSINLYSSSKVLRMYIFNVYFSYYILSTSGPSCPKNLKFKPG